MTKLLPDTSDRYFIHIICNVEKYFSKVSIDGESVSTWPVTGEKHLDWEEDLVRDHNSGHGSDIKRCDMLPSSRLQKEQKWDFDIFKVERYFWVPMIRLTGLY